MNLSVALPATSVMDFLEVRTPSWRLENSEERCNLASVDTLADAPKRYRGGPRRRRDTRRHRRESTTKPPNPQAGRRDATTEATRETKKSSFLLSPGLLLAADVLPDHRIGDARQDAPLLHRHEASPDHLRP